MTTKEVLHTLLGPELANTTSFIIYSGKKSERLNYVCEFIFNHSLKVNYSITNDIKEFEGSECYRINYSDVDFPNVFQVIPHLLLFEKGVSEDKTQSKVKDGLIYFFENEKGFHFDVFSAVFYFISRYEEWKAYEKDLHGRFELKESILFKNNFHLKPVVDRWIKEFRIEIEKTQKLKLPIKEFKTIATIDVDNLFAYKNKGFIRTLGAGLKDLMKFDFANSMRRNAVINNIDKDPFDIYEDFSHFCNDKKIPLYFFFLYKSGTKYDRTVDPSSKAFAEVFTTVKKNNAVIGLHPSYHSSVRPTEMKQQVESFSKTLGTKVEISRQHYLRFDIRTTPALLIQNGIVADFSMGFATGAGFRAGTSLPFYYYDFNSETKKDLLFVPFCAMDGAYFVYNSVSPEKAEASLEKIRNEIKEVNGLFITVFHERTFAEHLYPGFGVMYKKLLSA